MILNTAMRVFTTNLQVGSSLVVNATRATVSVVDITGNEPGTPVTVSGVSQTFGPYNDIVVLKVICNAGEVDITTNRTETFYQRTYTTNVQERRSTDVRVLAGSDLRVTPSAGSRGVIFDLLSKTAFVSFTDQVVTIPATAAYRAMRIVVQSGSATVRTAWAGGADTGTGGAPTPTPGPTPGPTPTPGPSMALSANRMMATSSPGVVIGDITGVPAGQTPTWTPTNSADDGKVVVAGSQGAGWKLVTGLVAAASTGTIAGNITAAGATITPATLTVVPLRTMFATGNQMIATSLGTPAAGNTRFIGRVGHYVSGDSAMKRLRVGFSHWYLSENAPYETKLSGSYTISDVFLEYNGQSVRATFAGGNSQVVDSNQYMYWTNFVPASAFGLSEFPAGAVIYWRVQGDVVAGQALAGGAGVASAGGNVVPAGVSFKFYDPANHIDQVSGAGAMTTPTSAANHPTGLSSLVGAVDGDFSNPNVPSTLFHGDSVVAFGMGNNSMKWNTATPTAGYVCAKIGAGMKGYAAANTYRKLLMQHANNAVIEDASNDISAYARTYDQIVADLELMFADLRAAGVRKILRTTLLCSSYTGIPITAISYDAGANRVTATVEDLTGIVSGQNYQVRATGGTGWGTPGATGVPITVISGTQFTYTPAGAAPTGSPNVTNPILTNLHDEFRSKGTQRLRPEWKAGGIRDQLHTKFAQWLASGVVDRVPDTLSAAADPTDNHYWRTDGTGGMGNGTSNLTTADGVHESSMNQRHTGKMVSDSIASLPREFV